MSCIWWLPLSLHVKKNLQLPMTNKVLAKVWLYCSLLPGIYFYNASLNWCPCGHPHATFVILFSSSKYSWKILLIDNQSINQQINQSLSSHIFIPILKLSNYFLGDASVFCKCGLSLLSVTSAKFFIRCYKFHDLKLWEKHI